MSRENVEIARRFVEAFNLGLDEFMAYYAEDAVHVTAPEWPEGGTYRGKEGRTRFLGVPSSPRRIRRPRSRM
jgi:hypothetical protein